jgi:hypothetical protein
MSKLTRERDYFNWLIAQIEIPAKNPHTYYDLFARLHDTEFIFVVGNDDNRIADGRDLRSEFLYGWKNRPRPVSTLEVLIALSRRTEFVCDEGTAPQWAWVLLENLGLHKMWDRVSVRKMNKIDEILANLIWRTYERDGRGGFFPLQYAREDQTKTEIWFQMQAYAIEKYGY